VGPNYIQECDYYLSVYINAFSDAFRPLSNSFGLSGVFGGKSVSLECITGQSERSRADFRHFQASLI